MLKEAGGKSLYDSDREDEDDFYDDGDDSESDGEGGRRKKGRPMTRQQIMEVPLSVL